MMFLEWLQRLFSKMKLAIIDYRSLSDSLRNRLAFKGIKVDIAESWDSFENKYGPLGHYDGLLLHPALKDFPKYLSNIPKKYPGLRYAVASNGLGEYLNSEKIKVFDFSDSEEIFEYFFGR